MEIPSKIEYDFLLILIGIFIIIFPFYIVDIYKTNLIISALIGYFGVVIFFYGLSLMKYEYEINLEMKELDYSKQKNEYLKYYIKENLLTKKRMDVMLKEIKDTIEQDNK